MLVQGFDIIFWWSGWLVPYIFTVETVVNKAVYVWNARTRASGAFCSHFMTELVSITEDSQLWKTCYPLSKIKCFTRQNNYLWKAKDSPSSNMKTKFRLTFFTETMFKVLQGLCPIFSLSAEFREISNVNMSSNQNCDCFATFFILKAILFSNIYNEKRFEKNSLLFEDMEMKGKCSETYILAFFSLRWPRNFKN